MLRINCLRLTIMRVKVDKALPQFVDRLRCYKSDRNLKICARRNLILDDIAKSIPFPIRDEPRRKRALTATICVNKAVRESQLHLILKFAGESALIVLL